MGKTDRRDLIILGTDHKGRHPNVGNLISKVMGKHGAHARLFNLFTREGREPLLGGAIQQVRIVGDRIRWVRSKDSIDHVRFWPGVAQDLRAQLKQSLKIRTWPSPCRAQNDFGDAV